MGRSPKLCASEKLGRDGTCFKHSGEDSMKCYDTSEEQEAQGALLMREVCCVPYTQTPCCQLPFNWAPGVLYS